MLGKLGCPIKKKKKKGNKKLAQPGLSQPS
jgi:hypothetical protein